VRDERFQLVHMLCQAISVPQSEAKEVRHYLSFVSTVVSRWSRVSICSNYQFNMSLRSCMSLGCGMG
jgi:hypothetical protein